MKEQALLEIKVEGYSELLKLKAALQDAENELKKVKKQSGSNSKEFEEQAKKVAELKAQIELKTTALKEDVKAEQKANETAEKAAKQAAQTTSEYKKKSKQLKELDYQYKELVLTQGAESEAAKSTLAQYTATKKELDDINEALGHFQTRVGNYEGALKEFGDRLEGMNNPISSVVVGVKQVNNSFKMLAANPILGIVIALSAALGVLFSAFKNSKTGAELITKATGLLNAGMSMLTKISSNLADGIKNVFDDPLGSIKNFGKAIQENALNRLFGFLEMIQGVSSALGFLFTGEMDKAKNAANEAGKAFVQIRTGLDVEQQKAFAKSAKEMTDEIKRQAAAFIALEEAKKAALKTNAELEQSIAKLSVKEQLAMQLRDDDTRTFDERLESEKEAMALTEQRAAKEVALAKNNLSILQQEYNLRNANNENTTDLYNQIIAATTGVIQAEGELLLTQRENLAARSLLRQDEAESELDILIDGYDNQRTINEARIADDKKTFDERIAILERTKELGNASFEEQIKIYNRFAKGQLDANKLINESDAVVLRDKFRAVGLSEKLTTRLLETVRERKNELQELSDVETKLLGEKSITQLQITEESKATILKTQLQKRLISQEEYNLKSNELEQERIRKELETLNLSEIEIAERNNQLSILESENAQKRFEFELSEIVRREQQKLLLLKQQFTNNELTKQEYENKSLELETAFLNEKLAKTNEFGLATIELQNELFENQINLNEKKNQKILESDQKTAQQKQSIYFAQLDLLSTLVNGTSQLLGQDEDNRRKYATALKALAIGEIAINLQRELSAIALQASSNPLNLLTFGVAGATQYSIQSVAALVKAGIATANVLQSFKTGGRVKNQPNIDVTDGDNVLVRVKAGEAVLNQEQIEKIGGEGVLAAIGVPGYNPVPINYGAVNEYLLNTEVMNNLPQPIVAIDAADVVRVGTKRLNKSSIR